MSLRKRTLALAAALCIVASIDGSASAELVPGRAGPDIGSFVDVNGVLFFLNHDYDSGYQELWRSTARRREPNSSKSSTSNSTSTSMN